MRGVGGAAVWLIAAPAAVLSHKLVNSNRSHTAGKEEKLGSVSPTRLLLFSISPSPPATKATDQACVLSLTFCLSTKDTFLAAQQHSKNRKSVIGVLVLYCAACFVWFWSSNCPLSCIVMYCSCNVHLLKSNILNCDYGLFQYRPSAILYNMISCSLCPHKSNHTDSYSVVCWLLIVGKGPRGMTWQLAMASISMGIWIRQQQYSQ
jgi:hypothetical protein